MSKKERIKCPWCGRSVAVNGVFEMYPHNNWSGTNCKGSKRGIVEQTIKTWEPELIAATMPTYRCATCGKQRNQCAGC